VVFSSLDFLFVFLPLALTAYYLVPVRFRRLCLLLFSLAFYIYGAWDKPFQIVLLLASSVVNWGVGLLLQKTSHRKAVLVSGLLYNFGWLFVFKYADFLFSSVQAGFDKWWPAAGVTLPQLDWILPLAISFYTFQVASYIIDVYRRTIPAESSFFKFSSYLCMFPQLISGPLVSYRKLSEQLERPRLSLSRIDNGIKDFTIGMGLKVLLANQIGGLWNDIDGIGFDSISTPLAWMGMIAFSLQLYFDFYGYSLMAIGLGKMLGFRLPDNFRHPYMSLSMTEFWRRWHITLGSWFREYLYIPLGGNRCSKWRNIFNLLIVWLATGFWHGASWNFLLWGLVIFCFITLEKYAIKPTLERFPVLGHTYMFFLIPLTFLIFAISDISQLGIYLERLFPFLPGGPINISPGDYLAHAEQYGWLLAIGLVFSTAWPRRIYNRIKNNLLGTLLLLAVFWLSVYCLYMGLNDPFMYFRF
jgi:alginate O-acetyltransferase complex protein AlgI